MTKTYLEPNQVPEALRGRYSGKKFAAVVCTETVIPADAGIWYSGTRDVYNAINFLTGAIVPFPGQQSAPWDTTRCDRVIKLEPGVAVMRHSIFCGTDMGLTFFVHPSNAAALLPAPAAELSEHEKIVLLATCSFKSSYNGQDRYEMMFREHRYAATKHVQAPFPTREEWDAAKQTLIGKKLLNKAGAVTPAGRNARPNKFTAV